MFLVLARSPIRVSARVPISATRVVCWHVESRMVLKGCSLPKTPTNLREGVCTQVVEYVQFTPQLPPLRQPCPLSPAMASPVSCLALSLSPHLMKRQEAWISEPPTL